MDRNVFFLNDRKKLSQFGHNVWKGRLVNTVMTSFNTIMGQMTKISQVKKRNPALRLCPCVRNNCVVPLQQVFSGVSFDALQISIPAAWVLARKVWVERLKSRFFFRPNRLRPNVRPRPTTVPAPPTARMTMTPQVHILGRKVRVFRLWCRRRDAVGFATLLQRIFCYDAVHDFTISQFRYLQASELLRRSLSGRASAFQLKGCVFDPRPLSKSP